MNADIPMTLTYSQKKVLNLLLLAASNREIAAQLKISTRTVKLHMNGLFRYFDINGGIKRVKLAVLVASTPILRGLLR